MFILSDVHGERGLMKPFLDSEEKICVQLGDFGFIWKHNDYKYNRFLNIFSKKYPEKEIYTVLGNHENYASLNKMPIVKKNGARCRKIRENVFAVERGEIISLEGKNCLCVGGADSIDKDWRIPEISWWSQEKILPETTEKVKDKISTSINIDYVFSHCMPYFFMNKVWGEWAKISDSEKELDRIATYLMNLEYSPSYWIGGHIHENRQLVVNDTTFISLGIGEYIIG